MKKLEKKIEKLKKKNKYIVGGQTFDGYNLPQLADKINEIIDKLNKKENV